MYDECVCWCVCVRVCVCPCADGELPFRVYNANTLASRPRQIIITNKGLEILDCPPSVYQTSPHVTMQISQAFEFLLCICILQVIKDWRWELPRNEAKTNNNYDKQAGVECLFAMCLIVLCKLSASRILSFTEVCKLSASRILSFTEVCKLSASRILSFTPLR